jgi:hypothetical protein
MIFSDFNDLNAMGLWIVGLKDSYFLIIFGLNSFSCVLIEYNMIDIPSVDYIPHYLTTLFEAKIYSEAGPIIEYTCTLKIVSTMQGNLI